MRVTVLEQICRGFVGLHIDITQLKLAEQLLRKERDFSKRLVDTAQVIVLVLDTEGRILTFNPYMEEISGYKLSEVKGKDWFSTFLPEADYSNMRALFRSAIGDINAKGQVNPILTKDGRELLIEWNDKTLTDSEENIVGLLCIGQDITAQQQALHTIIRQKESAQQYLDIAGVMFGTLDRNGNITLMNKKGNEILGYQEGELIGKDWFDVCLPVAEQKEVKEVFKRQMSGDFKPLEFYENPILNRAGEERLIAFHNTLLADETGIIGVLFSGEEITERKRAEKELKESEERFRLLVENSPDAVFVRDKDCFTYLNASAVRLFGADSEKDLIGTPVIERYHPKDRQKIRGRMQMINVSGNSLPLTQSVCLQLDGTEVDVESSVVPLEFQGEPSVLVFMRNIAERVEQQNREKNLEEQLHQSQKIESVGRLAGGVAHDYNNMLSVIIGHAEMAKRKLESTTPAQKDLEQILQAANRSQAINQQLLAFARKQIIKPQVLDLNESLEGMLKILQKLLGENIVVTWHRKGTLWPVKMDPSQLDQILANLCVNARDAIADTGHLTIETGVEHLDQDVCDQRPGLIPGDYVTLTTSDDGHGMDEETQEKIFEPFFTTKEVGVGTGLGLSTVYGIVKQSHGYIDVSSEPGKGTTFKIYLPRYEGPIEEALIEMVKKVHQGRGETVLLVEDEKVIVQMVTEMLEELGYNVLATNGPTEALSLVETYDGDIQLVLTDVVMPGMNGRELCERLQTFCPQLKCLYMSGYTADIIAQHGVLDDGVHFLQKPFKMTDFSAAIRSMLE